MNYDKYIPKHPNRNKVYNNFMNLLIKQNCTEAQKKALNIERGIFNICLNNCNSKEWNVLFQRAYINKAVVIYNNLNPGHKLNNTNLLNKVLNSEINEFDLCTLGPDNLFPEKYDDISLKYYDAKQSLKEIMTATEVIPEDHVGSHKCRKCQSWRTSYEMRQTRSGDESSSIFVTCFCGHKWKYNP